MTKTVDFYYDYGSVKLGETLLGIRIHRPEFDKAERLPALAHAILPEQDRPRRAAPDQESDGGHCRETHDQRNKRNRNLYRPPQHIIRPAHLPDGNGDRGVLNVN